MFTDSLTEVEIVICDCLDDDAARDLFISLVILDTNFDQVVLEQANVDCLRQVVSDADVSAAVEAMAADTDLAGEVASLMVRLSSCYPEGVVDR